MSDLSELDGYGANEDLWQTIYPSNDYRLLKMHEVLSEAASVAYISDLKEKTRFKKERLLRLKSFPNGADFMENYEKVKARRRKKQEMFHNELIWLAEYGGGRIDDILKMKEKETYEDLIASCSDSTRSAYFSSRALKREENRQKNKIKISKPKTVLDRLISSIEQAIHFGDKLFVRGPIHPLQMNKNGEKVAPNKWQFLTNKIMRTNGANGHLIPNPMKNGVAGAVVLLHDNEIKIRQRQQGQFSNHNEWFRNTLANMRA